jgi:hypothetical protein
MTQTTIPVELIALSGEPRIAELEDIDGLMRLYKTKVFRFVAFSVSDRDAAESITQDCFLKAHRTGEDKRPHAPRHLAPVDPRAVDQAESRAPAHARTDARHVGPDGPPPPQ